MTPSINHDTTAMATAAIRAGAKPFTFSPLTIFPANISTNAAMIRWITAPINPPNESPKAPPNQIINELATDITIAAIKAGPKPLTFNPSPILLTTQIARAYSKIPISFLPSIIQNEKPSYPHLPTGSGRVSRLRLQRLLSGRGALEIAGQVNPRRTSPA